MADSSMFSTEIHMAPIWISSYNQQHWWAVGSGESQVDPAPKLIRFPNTCQTPRTVAVPNYTSFVKWREVRREEFSEPLSKV